MVKPSFFLIRLLFPPSKKMTSCPLDEVPVPCAESVTSLMGRIGRPVPHWDLCTGRSGVNPMDNLRNQAALQSLDATVSALYVQPRKCSTAAPDLSADTNSPFRILGPAATQLPRQTIRQNLNTPSYRGISSVSFARSGLMTSQTRVGGAMIVSGTTSPSSWARNGGPGTIY